jgi:hypothetical protein
MQTTPSTASRNTPTVCAAATGTATMIVRAPCRRAHSTAATMVAPVAKPSSTKMQRRPATGTAARSRCRRASSASASARACATIASPPPPSRPTSGRRWVPPRGVTAPIAYSGWSGCPTLRTASASSGSPSALATSAATSTPPRAKPMTTPERIPSCATRSASWRPASLRSTKTRPPPGRRRLGKILPPFISRSIAQARRLPHPGAHGSRP